MAAVAVSLVLTSTALGCQTAIAGRKCKTNKPAQDATHVLVCKKGRWVRLISKADGQRLLDAFWARQAAEAATRSSSPPTGGSTGFNPPPPTTPLPTTPPPTTSPPTTSPPPPPTDPVGVLELVTGGRFTIRVVGTAGDPETTTPIDVRITVTGVPTTTVTATGGRFDTTVSALGGMRTVCVTALNSPGTAGTDLALGCRQVEVDAGAPNDPLGTTSSWLTVLNHYRSGAGLGAVAENPAWTDGIAKHLLYLRDTPVSYRTGAYASSHTENPAAPLYTPEGATAAASSNLSRGDTTARANIEGWLVAPFHAVGLIRPRLQTSAFAMLGDRAGLDVIRGLVPPTPRTTPVVFPGAGSTSALRAYRGGENPNPLESCPGYTAPTGAPIMALLASDPPSNITAELTLPNGAPVPSGDLCIITKHTYVTTDPVYGPTGASLLDSDDLVVIMPRQPLTPGTHTVRLQVPGTGLITWSFAVAR